VFVTIAEVADLHQFLLTFSTQGVEKRREHGCRRSHVFQDPEIPAIARELALRAPPVKIEPVAEYAS
jgi:hypothetical protein